MISDRQKLQFNVGVFNRVITISMNSDFLCELADVIDCQECKIAHNNGLADSIDACIESEKSYYAGKEYTLVRHGDVYQLVLDNTLAKDLSACMGDVLHRVRGGTSDVCVNVDVIFAFVKKLEMAAFNHFRELQDKQSTPRMQPMRQRNQIPYNQYPPFVRRYNNA